MNQRLETEHNLRRQLNELQLQLLNIGTEQLKTNAEGSSSYWEEQYKKIVERYKQDTGTLRKEIVEITKKLRRQ